MTTECYKFEKIIYDDGLFSKTIDATYVIHLEGNGRYNDIINQFNVYHPTNIVYIVLNKGYKKCKKADFINNTSTDLNDANLSIFRHAKENNYDNILVLEDDFIFNPEIKSPFHINNINNFLLKKKNKSFQYYISCIPFLMIPYDEYNYINKSTGTHSVVFSKKHRENLLNVNQFKISDWDVYNNKYFNRYAYYTPLCYQLFPETENSNNWGVNGPFKNITYFLGKLLKYFFNFLKMDKQVEPGYTIFYNFSKLLFYILVILSIIIIYNITKYTKLKLPYI